MTPTEELIIEVLAARYRLGDQMWTFRRNPAVTKAVNSLTKQNLVFSKSGSVNNTVLVGLSNLGAYEYFGTVPTLGSGYGG